MVLGVKCLKTFNWKNDKNVFSTANLTSWRTQKTVSPNDFDDDRQPKIVTLPSEPEILIPPKVWYRYRHGNANCKSGVSKKRRQVIATTSYNRKRLYCHFRLLVAVATSWAHFIRARRGRHPQICCCIFDAVGLHHSYRDINISGLAATLLFPVVHQCRIIFGNTSCVLAVVETLPLPLELHKRHNKSFNATQKPVKTRKS